MKKIISYKNFWSLNIDEAIAVGILRSELKKNVEIFMPMNAQMKDIDLAIINVDSKKNITIQVKGSRAFEPTEREKSFGGGSGGWYAISKKTIERCIADYFLFLVYVIENGDKRKEVRPHTILIPSDTLRKLVKKHKKFYGKDIYHFYLYVDPKRKIAFDHRNNLKKPDYYLSKYLDGNGIEKLNKKLSNKN